MIRGQLNRLVGSVAAAGAIAIASLGAPAAIAGGDKNCEGFNSQKQAQKYFKKKGGSKKNNVDGLDADGDGKACEDYPY